MKGEKIMKSLIKSSIFDRPSIFDKSFMLDRFFDDDWFFRGLTKSSNGQVNITEEKDGYSIEVSAPGFTKEELNINIDDDNILTITGEHKEEKNESKDDNCTRREFSKQSFERSFRIPKDVINDGFEAKFENGILRVDVKKPKELPKIEPKQIEIK